MCTLVLASTLEKLLMVRLLFPSMLNLQVLLLFRPKIFDEYKGGKFLKALSYMSMVRVSFYALYDAGLRIDSVLSNTLSDDTLTPHTVR